jgi:glycosyltransferase involved in cell wall biosynthesis
MRIAAILATYNERRFVGNCIHNLVAQGADIYLIDNESTDETVALARDAAGSHLLGVETFPREGVYRWRALLERKEALARELDADWVIHVDADELHLPPRGSQYLADAFAEAEASDCNAVNFAEFTFVPVVESPDHDHPGYLETMRWYYAFEPTFPHFIRAWKQHPQAELVWSGGHQVRFPGLALDPRVFRMKHYLFLSVDHVVAKYVRRQYDADEVEGGWHGWRTCLDAEDVRLPPAAELRFTRGDDDLDENTPRRQHWLDGFTLRSP